MNLIELLRDLTQASGISGDEAEARAVAEKAFAPYADALRTDALGNLIALKKGMRAAEAPCRAILLAAHMDEIGLMVTALEGSFLRFTRVGGVDVRTILGQEVLVHGRQPLPGLIGNRPPHVLTAEERGKPVPLQEMFIDTGLSAERLAALVRVGDLVTLRRDLVELDGGYVSGKALDDRAGVATLALALEALHTLRHEWDVFAVATTQEEVGCRGAVVSAYGVAPDIAIAVDVGFGAQRGVDEDESIKMDGGPSVMRGPNIHPDMYERLVSVAKEVELPYQVEVAGGETGTDAWAIQVARQGIPTALLSIPLRYMHTTVETAHLHDIQRTGRLMALFISGLNEEFAAQLGL
jgi:tetrahedral aminopeptidase